MHTNFALENGEKYFNAANHPVTVTHELENMYMFISDPEITQDLFTSKNMCFDKDSRFEKIF